MKFDKSIGRNYKLTKTLKQAFNEYSFGQDREKRKKYNGYVAFLEKVQALELVRIQNKNGSDLKREDIDIPTFMRQE
jgi:hypothetical protein